MALWQFWTQTGVQIAAASIALLMAVIAIWGDRIRARLSGPRLVLSLLDSQGEAIKLSDGTPSRFYHLRLHNERRPAKATSVRVVLTSVTKPAADGTMPASRLTGPIQLIWQHGHSLPQFPTVGPSLNAALGFVTAKGFQLTPLFVPNNLDIYVSTADKMLVEVVALADEAESNPVRIEISWNGKWSEDSAEMARNLVVKAT